MVLLFYHSEIWSSPIELWRAQTILTKNGHFVVAKSGASCTEEWGGRGGGWVLCLEAAWFSYGKAFLCHICVYGLPISSVDAVFVCFVFSFNFQLFLQPLCKRHPSMFCKIRWTVMEGLLEFKICYSSRQSTNSWSLQILGGNPKILCDYNFVLDPTMAARSFEIWWLWWDYLIDRISLFGQVSPHPCPLFNFFSPPAEQCCSRDPYSSSSTSSLCSAASSTTRTLVRTQVEMARWLVALTTGGWLTTMQTYWRSPTKLMSAVKEMEGNISYPKAFAHSSITSTNRTATQGWSGRQSSLCPTGSLTTSWSTPGSTSPRHLLQQQHQAQQQPQKRTPRSSGWPTRSSSTGGPPTSSPSLTIPGAPGLLFRGFPFMASHKS